MATAGAYGLAIGAVVGALAIGLRAADAPALLTSAVVVGVATLVSRGLHLDGLADTVDALGSYGDRDRALAIMKSPEVGPFGVVAIVFALVIPIAAIDGLLDRPWWAVLAATAVGYGTGRLAATWACRVGRAGGPAGRTRRARRRHGAVAGGRGRVDRRRRARRAGGAAPAVARAGRCARCARRDRRRHGPSAPPDRRDHRRHARRLRRDRYGGRADRSRVVSMTAPSWQSWPAPVRAIGAAVTRAVDAAGGTDSEAYEDAAATVVEPADRADRTRARDRHADVDRGTPSGRARRR